MENECGRRKKKLSRKYNNEQTKTIIGVSRRLFVTVA